MKIININRKMVKKIRIANTSNQIYPQDELLHIHRYCETEEHGGKQRTGQVRTGQDGTGQDRTGQDRTGQDRTGQDRTGQDRIIGSLMKQDKIRLYKIYPHSQQSYLGNQIQFTMIILIV